MGDNTLEFSRTLYENTSEFSQWRLTVSEFRGVSYLGLRKYFLTYEGTWEPSKEGVNIELTLTFTYNLFRSLADLLSKAELDLENSEVKKLLETSQLTLIKGIIDALPQEQRVE